MPNGISIGIVGGFAPPAPTAVKTVAYTAQTKELQISSSSSLAPRVVKEADFVDVDALVEQLQSILKTLPTEDPKGSEDIYGLDTSIMWGSDNFVWENAGAQGCGTSSTVKATDKDKAQFKKALEIAEKLVAKGIGS